MTKTHTIIYEEQNRWSTQRIAAANTDLAWKLWEKWLKEPKTATKTQLQSHYILFLLEFIQTNQTKQNKQTGKQR